jgi:hypothetical protein
MKDGPLPVWNAGLQEDGARYRGRLGAGYGESSSRGEIITSAGPAWLPLGISPGEMISPDMVSVKGPALGISHRTTRG